MGFQKISLLLEIYLEIFLKKKKFIFFIFQTKLFFDAKNFDAENLITLLKRVFIISFVTLGSRRNEKK